MKAVVMAGGEGSRLRPVTCDLPKPMARICGKPVVEYIFDLLIRNGFTEAYLTLGYLPEVIREHFESDEYKSLKLNFVTEEKPLGTAGGVKNAADGFTETFAVISGDAMCDFDLKKAVEFHKSRHAAITIIGSRVEDPREYGLIKSDDDGLITGFIEKPSWGQATTNLANTGIYIINGECMKLVDAGVPFDFAKDLFPKMMEMGLPLYCFEAEGYWCDIGDIGAYLKCQQDMLNGKIKYQLNSVAGGVFVEDKIPKGDYSIIPPVYIGEQVEIGNDAVIGPGAVIDRECLIGDGVYIRESVMLRGSCAMHHSSMTNALLCRGSTLKEGASMFEGSVVGFDSVIGENSNVKHGVLVWPQKCIAENTEVVSNVKYGSGGRSVFDDSGVSGSLGVEITPETCALIGASIGSIKTCKKVGIACDGSSVSKTLMLALISGLMSVGSHVWSFGECFESQLSFCTSFCGLGTGIFVSGDINTPIKICGEGGLSIPRNLEREIESRVSKREFNRCSSESCRDLADMSSIRMMYPREMMKQAPYELKGISVGVNSENEKITLLLEDTLAKLGCSKSGEITLNVNPYGTEAFISTADKSEIPFEKLLSICCYNELKNGRDIALPFNAPMVLDALAASCGRRAYRYLSSPADNSDSMARRLSSKQIWVRDALFMSVRLLSVVKEREMSVSELYEELPEFYIAKKTFELNFPPSKLAELVGEENTESGNLKEGIVVKREQGKIMIMPSRSGRRVRVTAEAESMELAEELCGGFEKLLN